MRSLAKSPYRRRGQRGWTPAQRAAQAVAIRRHRPWLRSTGPRSGAGKAKCCGNALKHGMRSAPMREIWQLLRAQRRYLQRVLAFAPELRPNFDRHHHGGL